MNSFFAKSLIVGVCFPIAAAMQSCGNGGSTAHVAVSGNDSLSASTDEPEVIEPLPDTAYSSADIVKYRIENADTTLSGEINSLADMYVNTPGAFTFRKGTLRQADFGGKIADAPTDIVVDWEFKTELDNRSTSTGTWGGGSGWTGQPLYVHWPDTCIAAFRKAGISCAVDEIMVGSLASRVYFIDLATGKASRRAIDVHNPIKGTISLDPTLNGNLYVGQGIPAERPFGALVIDLYKAAITHTVAEDPKAQRRWQAYDSSPVRVGQFLFRPGENGTIYKYMVGTGTLKLHSALRYTVNGAAPGIESSMAVYRNYGYTADNRGNVLCINLNTMKPVWRSTTGDDTDATPVLVIEHNHPYLYVGSEIDLQDVGYATFLKLDALTGATVWEAKIPGRRVNLDTKHFDGGFYSTALPGEGDCQDLIFANCVSNEGGQTGDFIALNRADGSIVYKTRLRYYSWSSPVSLMDNKGKMYVFTGDCAGNAYVIDGRSGRIIVRKHIGNNFESSPVVIPGTATVVIGSRGNSIYRLSIK